MHIDKARKVGAGLAGGAAAVVFGNFINIVSDSEGKNPNGIFTFLYTASVLAIIASIFMIDAFHGKQHHREKIMHHKMIAIAVLVIIDIVFAIPSIDWIQFFFDYGASSEKIWGFRFILGILLQTFATLWFIYYSRMHVQGANIGGYIAAPHGVHH